MFVMTTVVAHRVEIYQVCARNTRRGGRIGAIGFRIEKGALRTPVVCKKRFNANPF